jgi:hypothetical protein
LKAQAAPLLMPRSAVNECGPTKGFDRRGGGVAGPQRGDPLRRVASFNEGSEVAMSAELHEDHTRYLGRIRSIGLVMMAVGIASFVGYMTIVPMEDLPLHRIGVTVLGTLVIIAVLVAVTCAIS